MTEYFIPMTYILMTEYFIPMTYILMTEYVSNWNKNLILNANTLVDKENLGPCQMTFSGFWGKFGSH